METGFSPPSGGQSDGDETPRQSRTALPEETAKHRTQPTASPALQPQPQPAPPTAGIPRALSLALPVLLDRDFAKALTTAPPTQWPEECGPHQTARILLICLDISRIFSNRFGRILRVLEAPPARIHSTNPSQWTRPKMCLPWGHEFIHVMLRRVAPSDIRAPAPEPDFYPGKSYTDLLTEQRRYFDRVFLHERDYGPLHLSLGWIQDHKTLCSNRIYWLDNPKRPFMLPELYDNRCQCFWEPTISFACRPHRREHLPGTPAPPYTTNSSIEATFEPYIRLNSRNQVVQTRRLSQDAVRHPQVLVLIGGRDTLALDWLEHVEVLIDLGMSMSKRYATERAGPQVKDCWNVEICTLMVELPSYGFSRGAGSVQSSLDTAVAALRNEISWYEGRDVEVHIISYSLGSVVALRLARLLVEARILAQDESEVPGDLNVYNDPILARAVLNTMILMAPIGAAGGTVRMKQPRRPMRGVRLIAEPRLAARNLLDDGREMTDLLEMVAAHPEIYDEFLVAVLAGKEDAFFQASKNVGKICDHFNKQFPQIVSFNHTLPGDHKSMFWPAMTIRYFKLLFPIEEWFAYGETPIYFEPPVE